jgi:enamine deaminase RidA (YjgF/YER057c/UK114 family)
MLEISLTLPAFGRGKVYSGQVVKDTKMQINTPRRYFNRIAMMIAAVSGAPRLLAQTPAASNRIHDGIYYFPGIGSNSGYPKDDRILVTDPFEKHATRTMDALKKSLERAGCTMDSILHLEVFTCLPHSDNVPMPTGKARFEAQTAQYQAFNKIYGTYFSPGRAPSRAYMAVDWIPGDSLVEVVGSARVVTSPAPPA